MRARYWGLAVVGVFCALPLFPQWFHYPTPGVPRLPNGKPNLAAPAPKTADGKPDLSGIWLGGHGLPYQPWAAALVRQRVADHSKDDPHARCMPPNFPRAFAYPHHQKFIQNPGLLVILDEFNASYRQIFTDGRPFPEDPQPSWNGYSSGKWEGDTLVVQSIGFRDDLW